jgi:hypothetical protein
MSIPHGTACGDFNNGLRAQLRLLFYTIFLASNAYMLGIVVLQMGLTTSSLCTSRRIWGLGKIVYTGAGKVPQVP